MATLKMRTLSSAHLGRFERLVNDGDQAAALAYCVEHAGEMSGADIAKARELIGATDAHPSGGAAGVVAGGSADGLLSPAYDRVTRELGAEGKESPVFVAAGAPVRPAASLVQVRGAKSAGSAQTGKKGQKPGPVAPGTGPTEAEVQAARALLSRRLVPRARWGARAPNLLTMKRQSEKYDTITLHHTGNHDTPKEVESLHRGDEDGVLTWLGLKPPYGWSDVGYHFMISRDGKVYQGRLLEYEGAHVGKHNPGNIGIAMLGDHTNEPLTAEQLKSLRALVTMLSHHQNIKHIKTHGEFDQVKKQELRGAFEQIKPLLRP